MYSQHKLVGEFNNSKKKIIFMKAISVRSFRMFFLQFWKCFVIFKRNGIK